MMMKQLFTLFCILLTGIFSVQAQSFSVTPNPSTVTAPSTDEDVENYVTLTNNVPFAKTMRWTRTVIYISDPSLESQVCDNIQCYLPSVSSKTFPLAGNESFQMIMHLLNPNEIAADAIIHLKVNNENAPADSLTIVYAFSITTGVGSPLGNAGVSFFPNPASDFVQLTNADPVAALRMYTMDGRLAAYRIATPDHRYDISTLQPGTYVLGLENAEGRLIQAMEVVRQ